MKKICAHFVLQMVNNIRFKNPIELVSYNELSPDNFTPRNFDGIGTVSGVEIEVKKSKSREPHKHKLFQLWYICQCSRLFVLF